ncbi:MAG: hypothetical protein ACPHY8_00470 [Patescibacteria group bacterium]
MIQNTGFPAAITSTAAIPKSSTPEKIHHFDSPTIFSRSSQDLYQTNSIF